MLGVEGKCKLISTTRHDSSLQFRKQEIIDTWEQDWDEEYIYFVVNYDGWVTKVNLQTCDVYKYHIERVEH